MTIQDKLIEPFVIEITEDQYILKEIKPIDTSHHMSKGEEGEREVIHGYFVELSPIVKKIIKLKLAKEESVVTLKEFATKWVDFYTKFNELFDGKVYQGGSDPDVQGESV